VALMAHNGRVDKVVNQLVSEMSLPSSPGKDGVAANPCYYEKNIAPSEAESLTYVHAKEVVMRRIVQACAALFLTAGSVVAADRPVAPNGIAYYPDYMGWQVVAPSYRPDKGQIRVITGNAVAVAALRAGKKPLPDGSVLAKVAWKAEKHPSFPAATVPGAFAQVEFMVKDAKKYKNTGGWGFARFVGNTLKPYGKDATFVSECFGCHIPVALNDYLYTKIVKTP
jgi:hypothetical protein